MDSHRPAVVSGPTVYDTSALRDISEGSTPEQANQTYFDRWAKSYDSGRISRWFQYTQELTIGLMDLTPRSKVLDVGCGTGFAVLLLGSMFDEGKACGIDISSKMMAEAQVKVPDILKERVEFRQASSDNIPYPSEEFEYIMCTNSFHHYPDPLTVLAEMSRLLKPGGRVVILDNAVDLSLYTWLWDRILRIIEKGHVRYYRSWEIGEMLKQARFQGVELRHLKNEFMKHGKLFASLQVWSGQKPRGDQSE